MKAGRLLGRGGFNIVIEDDDSKQIFRISHSIEGFQRDSNTIIGFIKERLGNNKTFFSFPGKLITELLTTFQSKYPLAFKDLKKSPVFSNFSTPDANITYTIEDQLLYKCPERLTDAQVSHLKDALKLMQQKAVWNNDIKIDNILQDKSGNLLITDWDLGGLAVDPTQVTPEDEEFLEIDRRKLAEIIYQYNVDKKMPSRYDPDERREWDTRRAAYDRQFNSLMDELRFKGRRGGTRKLKRRKRRKTTRIIS